MRPDAPLYGKAEEATAMTRIRITTRPSQGRPRPPLDLRTPSGRPLPY